ncbi:MAG: lysophospholipid acyltransferase family protein [Acidimicrobiales bacterium]
MSQAQSDNGVGRHYWIAKYGLKPLSRFFFDVKMTSAEHIPETGPAIFAANHISFMDSALLMTTLPRQITFVGKAEYMDDWKTKHLFPAIGMIPIDRSGGSASRSALDAAAGVLEDGRFFGIFPEGTRSRNGKLHKGHTGVARLAMRTGAPVIPVGVVGTDLIQPCDAPLPRPFMPAELKFGRPISPERYSRKGGVDRLALRQMTDEIMFEVSQMTGQEYVARYATRKSETVPTPEAALPTTSMAAVGG